MAAWVLFPSQDRDSDWQCRLLYPVGSKSTQLLGLPTFLLPVSAEQSDTEHATAFPLARRLNPRGNPAGCKNNPASPTRPPNLAMMDAVVFEVESASSPTSSLCRSGGFVPPVCVLGRGGQVPFPCGKSDLSQCSVVLSVVLGGGKPGWLIWG